jgi:D-alanyl-D-alanine-carboxypeptidase/D-alanyl-D-alanine-endopeptidase
MVLVVVRGPDSLVQGYGQTTMGNGNEPDGPSLLRLGLVSKIFATELLAGMATEGQPRPTDPLRQCVVAPVTVPWSGERAVRTGVARDRHKLFPPMPFAAYQNLAADDMEA